MKSFREPRQFYTYSLSRIPNILSIYTHKFDSLPYFMALKAKYNSNLDIAAYKWND